MPTPTGQIAVCGALNPPGHVVVYDEKHTTREGKVCSTHTFWEVISHSSDRFMVEITMDPGPHPFTDALERVHARHGLMVATPKRKPRALTERLIEGGKRAH